MLPVGRYIMFGLLKEFFYKKENEDTISPKPEADEDEKDSRNSFIGNESIKAINGEIQNASAKFDKPVGYTGNRNMYDSDKAKINAKNKAFGDKTTIKDPYTGGKITKTQKDSLEMYGNIDYSAESDHIVPLEKIYDENADNPWLTSNDIKEVANSEENLVVTSRKFNNYKRSKTNKEVVKDSAERKEKNIYMTSTQKKRALRDEENAENYIDNETTKRAAKNLLSTTHEAGINTAKVAGVTAATMAGISNIVDCVKGKKKWDEALLDTAESTVRAGVIGYCSGGGVTAVAHTLSKSSTPFIQALTKSNIPGYVVTSIMTFGGSLKRLSNGDISMRQFMLEAGNSGLNLATSGYAAAVGQTFIPIPIVGAAVGALVGMALTDSYFSSLMTQLQQQEIAAQERLRIRNDCEQVAAQARAYKEELDKYLAEYFKEYQSCFDNALSAMQVGLETGDYDSVIAGSNRITQKLGGNVYFNNVEEYKSFLDSDEPDIL